MEEGTSNNHLSNKYCGRRKTPVVNLGLLHIKRPQLLPLVKDCWILDRGRPRLQQLRNIKEVDGGIPNALVFSQAPQDTTSNRLASERRQRSTK